MSFTSPPRPFVGAQLLASRILKEKLCAMDATAFMEALKCGRPTMDTFKMSKMKYIVRKWQKLARVGKVYTSADVQFPETNGSDGENEEFASSAACTTPEGYEVVYIGESRRRYVIDGKHLEHPLFRALSKRSEEFGVDQSLGLSLGCEVVLFEHLLWLLDTSDPIIDTTSTDSICELAELYMPVRDSASLSSLHDE